MTKEEAIEAIDQGKSITHGIFLNGIHVKKIDDNTYQYSDGEIVEKETFWKFMNGVSPSFRVVQLKSQAMNRIELTYSIARKKEEVEKLKEEILLLTIEEYKLCDDQKWYTEEDVEVVVSKRPKRTEIRRRGIIHWMETFNDSDSKESIQVERSEVVMDNDVWYIKIMAP